ADFGADVIKIEHPRQGDGQRKLEPIKDGIPLWWKVMARNKRCITLDLSKPEGAALFKQLVRSADVGAENYRPGTFERWSLGYDGPRPATRGSVRRPPPGWGQPGPPRDRPAFARPAGGRRGLTTLSGERAGPPMTPGYPLGDLIAGIFGAFAIMTA